MAKGLEIVYRRAIHKKIVDFQTKKNNMGDKECPRCGGDGTITCPRCNGKGYVSTNEDIFDDIKTIFIKEEFVDCSNCDGDGEISCARCGGNGVVADDDE